MNDNHVKNLLLPHDTEAEMRVLGAMMLGGVTDLAAELLAVDDFYRAAHAHIFDAMLALAEKGAEVEPAALKTELAERGILDQIGGVGFLLQLGEIEFTTANLKHYASIVRGHSVRRRTITAAAEIYRQAFDVELPPDDLLTWARNSLQSCEPQQGGTEWFGMKEMVADFADSMKARQDSGTGLTGLSTRITSIDRATRGFRKGELLILAGRPAMGKSACGAQVALNVARNGGRVAFFSAEMNRASLMDRFVAAESRVPLTAIMTGFIDAEQRQRLRDTAERLQAFPLKVDDTPGLSVSLIESKCRKFRHEFGDIDLIVVDYLQYLAPSEGEKFGGRYEKVTDVARKLKSLARNMNAPVLALAQLNRGVEHRDNKRPVLSDLAESGAIEAEADAVMFLYRPSYYGKRLKFNGDEEPIPQTELNSPDRAICGSPCDLVQLIVAKNRNGPVGNVKLAFLPELTRFDDLAPEGIH